MSTTLAELEKRVETLEKIISSGELRVPQRNAKWWLARAGAFAADPGYNQLVLLGKRYRNSLGPKRRKPRH
jgi:hypothetical protein